ncbi:MAG: undecaprenyl-diphosphate phosphatase [Planctomycetota bacterium]
MEWWQAIVLGIVEGVTEYLPISSTGHLILAQRAMGIGDGASSRAFAICIQAGAIAAVLGIYFPRVLAMSSGKANSLLVNLLVAFLPAAAIGFLAEDAIDENLFGIWPVVVAWFVGGVLIVAFAGRLRGGWRSLESLDVQTALLIGLFQCFALWPGTSRSLTTIAGGLLLGLSMSAAVEFSLLLGLVTLGAATAFKAFKHGGTMLDHYGGAAIALGFLCAAVSAWVAVKWMVAWLERRGLAIFGWYRVALAIVVAAWLFGYARAGN